MSEIDKSEVEICQITTGHTPTDNRILHLMARTLSDAGYDSNIIGAASKNGSWRSVRITACPVVVNDVTKPSRFAIQKQLFRFARQCSAQVFQIHDPDMLPWALMLRCFGKTIIYDVHDDYQASFKDRFKERKLLRWLIPTVWWWFERNAARLMNGVVVADRHLSQKFEHCDPVILGNYPRLDFTRESNASREDTFNLIYVGGITRERGLEMVFRALQLLPMQSLRLHLIGNGRDEDLLELLGTDKRIVLHGRVDWTELHDHYEHAHMGLALYQPLDGFLYYPGENAVKILEYMAAGIPVLTSDFPGLKTFVADSGYGLCVKPDDPKAIADAIMQLYEDEPLRRQLGHNGRGAFEEKYNWEQHEQKLIELYERILR